MDIYLLIGQSNMAGRGLLNQVPALNHPHIHMFRNNHWQPATEPLHQDKSIAGVGLAMSFAHEMVHRFPALQIGLIPTAVGGTPLSRWMPDGDLYLNAVAQTHAAISQGGTLRGFLWHQGENDSNHHASPSTYGRRLREMIAAIRQEFVTPVNSPLPFIAGELGPFLANLPNHTGYKQVNEQLHLLETMVPHYAVASAANLTDNGDHVHFNATSLRTFGVRYADALCKMM